MMAKKFEDIPQTSNIGDIIRLNNVTVIHKPNGETILKQNLFLENVNWCIFHLNFLADCSDD
jgi:hypothetical protein